MTSNAEEKQEDPPQMAIGNEGGNPQGATTEEQPTAALASMTDEEPTAMTETQELLNKKERYFCKDPLGGTWIHAQARLHVALLGPKPKEEKKESSEEEEKDAPDEEEENSAIDDQSVGSYESDMMKLTTKTTLSIAPTAAQFSTSRRPKEPRSLFMMSLTTTHTPTLTLC